MNFLIFIRYGPAKFWTYVISFFSFCCHYIFLFFFFAYCIRSSCFIFFLFSQKFHFFLSSLHLFFYLIIFLSIFFLLLFSFFHFAFFPFSIKSPVFINFFGYPPCWIAPPPNTSFTSFHTPSTIWSSKISFSSIPPTYLLPVPASPLISTLSCYANQPHWSRFSPGRKLILYGKNEKIRDFQSTRQAEFAAAHWNKEKERHATYLVLN